MASTEEVPPLTPIVVNNIEVHPQEPHKAGSTKGLEHIELHLGNSGVTTIARLYAHNIDDAITALVTYRNRNLGAMDTPLHLLAADTFLMERCLRGREDEVIKALQDLGYKVEQWKPDIHGNNYRVWPKRVTRPGPRTNESTIVRDCEDVATLEGVLEYLKVFGHVSSGEIDRFDSGALFRAHELESVRKRSAKTTEAGGL